MSPANESVLMVLGLFGIVYFWTTLRREHQDYLDKKRFEREAIAHIIKHQLWRTKR